MPAKILHYGTRKTWHQVVNSCRWPWRFLRRITETCAFYYGTNISQLDTILQRMRRRDISILCRIAFSKTLWRYVCLHSTVLWNPPASSGRWALLILALTMINARWRHQAACDRFSYSNDVSIVINLWLYDRWSKYIMTSNVPHDEKCVIISIVRHNERRSEISECLVLFAICMVCCRQQHNMLFIINALDVVGLDSRSP